MFQYYVYVSHGKQEYICWKKINHLAFQLLIIFVIGLHAVVPMAWVLDLLRCFQILFALILIALSIIQKI